MEDHIVQLDAPVLEIEALDHGLQGEVIIFTSQLRVSSFQICLTVCWFHVLSNIPFTFLLIVCRMRYRMHKTPVVQFRTLTLRRQSLRYESLRRLTPTRLFIGFDSGLLVNPVCLFPCAGCDVSLLFGLSMRLMYPDWKMSLLWVTVTVTVLCTCLPTTTLMSSFMCLTISWLLGIYYGKLQMKSSILCSVMIPTLSTLLARCSSFGRGTIVWPRGLGTLTSIIRSTKIGICRLTALSLIQETAQQFSWMLWMTSIGEFFRFTHFVFLFNYPSYFRTH